MKDVIVRIFCLWVLLFVSAGCASGSGRCPEFAAGQSVGRLQSPLISEASGMAASRKNPGILWTHNDHGHAGRLYAIKTTGELVTSYIVMGAASRDWEDIAIGPGPDPNEHYIYIGDIGDNNAKRQTVVVYRVVEPAVDVNAAGPSKLLRGAETIELRYPDGARNAETLLLDPVTKDIYIVSKENKTKVYRAGYPQSTSEVTTMEKVAKIDLGTAVGGDISQDGTMIIIRGYFSARLWSRPAGGTVADAISKAGCRIPLVFELQGEAICFDAENRGYFTTSEHKYQPMYYFARKAEDKGN